MEFLLELFDTICEILYYDVIEPVIMGIASFLNLLVVPISSFTPRTQIIIVSFVGAVLSRIFVKIFKSKREKALQEEFKEKISSLKHTRSIGDVDLEKVLKSGINKEADKVYEKILLDKFFEMGITYFFPLFFFLIWLEYSLFTPENLKSLTGSPYAWVTAGGLKLSAAHVYLYSFNIVLFGLWFVEAAARFVLKRIKKK